MISKKLLIPMRLLADQALLEHLPSGHPAKEKIEADLAKCQAGFRGEQNLAYFLDSFQNDDWHIFYALKLKDCQIDTLLLTPTFISLLESKNYSGAVRFETNGQFLRRLADRYEGYPNPLLQVGRHRVLLRKWLINCGLPQMPLEADVTIAFPTTIIENPGNLPHVQEHVFHAEHAPLKLERLMKKYEHTVNFANYCPQIQQQLLQEHIDETPNVLTIFNVHQSELRRGIRCDKCRSFDMQRIYANWYCAQCGHKSKIAHIPMILDYFLLLGSTMSNKQCREFLRVSDRKLIRNLLIKLGFSPKGNGTGPGLYYERPSHEWAETIHKKYRSTKKG